MEEQLNEELPCKVCGEATRVVYNISFKAKPICNSCGRAIFAQQAVWYVQTEMKKEHDEG